VTVRQVDVAEGIRLHEAGYRVVDVREPDEWASGHISGATHIPLGQLTERAGAELPDRDEPLLLQCRSGARSGRAAEYLASIGYTDVVNLQDLVERWAPAGGPWEAPGPSAASAPSADARYGRQVAVPDVGPEGQRRLGDARVLIVGVGGLGSPAALYLAAAGVGTIGLVDDDRVELSNLHRQVIHPERAVGRPKVASGAEALAAANATTRVVTGDLRVTQETVERVLTGWDVVVDATDSLEARYVLNDAAVRRQIPLVHGSVYRWEGEVTTIVPFAGPCYRCLHPSPPPDDLAPSCDVAGVVGVVPGVIGTIQAAEALKLILGTGEPLAGRQLLVDLRSMRFEELRAARDPACPACGEAVGAAVAAG
jgi:molybdopterin/thiamine biosynthesis adenylyltransferase/rhodanese-related sulfurtransferase